MVLLYKEAVAPVRPLAENETVTHEGGIAFRADKWTRLRRFLVLGTQSGTFYATGRDLTVENVAVVRECLDADGPYAVGLISGTSNAGLAPKNEPAILALAMASAHPDEATRRHAWNDLPLVCRTGTHLLHFAAYREALGAGWGRGMRRAVGAWFNAKSPRDLAYQAVKYKSRDGWALSDLLRLSHPKPASLAHDFVMKYVVDGWDAFVGTTVENDGAAADAVAFLDNCRTVELGSDGAVERIRQYRIPREAIPTAMLNSPEVWATLLDDMPMGAIVRNLGKMSAVGLLTERSEAEKTVVSRLLDGERLRKARVHPIALLAALKVYEQGHGEKGSLKWKPAKGVLYALDLAFYAAFKAIEPTGRRIRLCVDVSGSMGQAVNGMPFLSAREVAGAMALVTANVEPQAEVVGFTNKVYRPLPIRPSMRLDEVTRILASFPPEWTFCSAPIREALETGTPFDAFVQYTDGETADGSSDWRAPSATPAEVLRRYREAVGLPTKLAVAAVCANGLSLADKDDAGMMDCVGFSSDLPAVIAGFVNGEM